MKALRTQPPDKIVTPFEFLVISIAPDRYTIAGAIQDKTITTVSRLPFNKTELRDYQMLLKEFNKTSITREAQHRMRQFSQRLFDFLIGDHPEMRSAYDNVFKNSDERLVINIAVDNSRPLAELPWELMCDSNGDYIGLSQRTPISRFFPGNRTATPVPAKLPLRVLVVIPSPPNYGFVDVVQEWTVFNEALEDLQASGTLVLERLLPPSGAALRRQLRTYDYALIHFVGPVYVDEATEEAGIVMEEKSNRSGSQPQKMSQIAFELGDNTTVRLLICNLYETNTRRLSGIGRQLAEGTSTSGLICGDMNLSARKLYLKKLYHELCAFQPIDRAVTLTRQQLADNFNTFDWAKPMIFSKSPHSHLFRPY